MAGSDARLRAPESVLTVDRGAIVANYRALAARAAPAQCAAVVKADAYGLGAVHVGPALARAGCRHFFVAHLGEAVELRSVVPAPASIYVLNGLARGDVEDLLAHDLIPVLNDLSQVDGWAAPSRRLGRTLPAVIQFDTRMSRLGLEDGEFRTLHTERSRLASLDLRFVMSHLACAEETDNPLNRAQLAEFRSIRAAFPDSKASFANSSAIFLGPDYAFDLVRPGCALYGINPLLNKKNPMQPTARLESRILQVRRVDHPRTVGYGATHRVSGPTRIATIAIGYADGWLRSLSGRGVAYCGDRPVPFLGRVSMDLVTLDVTAAPDAKIGDLVELMGPHQDVDAVAAKAGTIGYEILTRLGRRFHRTYIGAMAGA
jgi:alanine racemase